MHRALFAVIALILAACAPGAAQLGDAGEGQADLAARHPDDPPLPVLRPAHLRVQAPLRTRAQGKETTETQIAAKPGMVCGDPRLQGQAIAPIGGAMPGCGIEAPVRLISISGVALSTSARLDCETARTTADWLADASDAAEETLGAKLSKITVAASYACRRRNSRAAGPLSSHAHGRAIDISAFDLTDGRRVTVKRDWRGDAEGAFLKQVWSAACGPFVTVLGPEADAHHRDHFHLDRAATHRQPYCR